LESLNKEEEKLAQLELKSSSSSGESLSPSSSPPTHNAILTNNATKVIEQRLNEREWQLLLTNST